MANLVSWVPRINVTKLVEVTPTISTSIYASGDQIGGVMTISNAVRIDNQALLGQSQLVDVTILDSDKQSAAIDIWLFKSTPTLASSDNAAFSITAANMLSAGCLGYVSVGASYSAAAAVSCSSTTNLGKIVESSTTSIYAVAVVRGTPTYTTTTSLKFAFNFYVD